MLKGVDISDWQGDVDFDKLKTAVDFVFIKATEGNGFVAKNLGSYQSEARRVGLALGYYHFARPDYGNSANAEADWFLNSIKDLRDGEFLALDFEVGYANAVSWCKSFLDRISSKLGGYKPVIYLNLSQTQNFNWKPVVDASYGLWLAYYHDTLPAVPWPVIAFHQFTNAGTISGINGRVDVNYFYGDKDALRAYSYQVGVISAPPCENYEYYKERAGYFDDALELVGLTKGSKWSPFKATVKDIQKTVTTQKTRIGELETSLANNVTPLDQKKDEKYIYSTWSLLSEALNRFKPVLGGDK